MNSALITMILQAVSTLLQQTGLTTKAIQNGIALLSGLVPVLVKEYRDVLPYVQNIITVLKSSDKITDAQMADLEAMEAKLDADWDAAVDAYTKNHPKDGTENG